MIQDRCVLTLHFEHSHRVCGKNLPSEIRFLDSHLGRAAIASTYLSRLQGRCGAQMHGHCTNEQGSDLRSKQDRAFDVKRSNGYVAAILRLVCISSCRDKKADTFISPRLFREHTSSRGSDPHSKEAHRLLEDC